MSEHDVLVTDPARPVRDDVDRRGHATRPKSGPPPKHHLALMIWLAVFPTLTVLNIVLGPWLRDLPTVLRTLVLATLAVPVVVYGLMPPLHRARAALLARIAHLRTVRS